MKREEILKKAIEKAVKNGYFFQIYEDDVFRHFISDYQLEHIIFNHDFAKTFWGEKKCKFETWELQGHFDNNMCKCGNDNYDISHHWQYHLQQLALAEDRLDYIKKFL